MNLSVLAALKGITGEFELNRVVGAIGAMVYIVGAHVFLGVEVFVRGRAFDLEAYCIAFPSGLGIAVAAVAGAVALKDRQVAKARADLPAGPQGDPLDAQEPGR